MSDDIPTYLNSEFFGRVLQQNMHSSNVQITTLSLRDLTVAGENYCSRIYQAIVKFRRQESSEQEHTKYLIVKSMPDSGQGVLRPLNIYSKETVFYLDIKPKMETLMWCRNTAEKWQLGASHLYSTPYPEQNIIFEDLKRQGFEQLNREIGLNLQHSIMVIRKLAEYHALSMTIAQKEPEKIIDHYPYGLLNAASIKSDSFKMLFGGQLLKLAALIADDPAYMNIAKDLLKYYDEFAERVDKAVHPLQGQLNVLNHGDLWVNNLFFRYEDGANADEDVREVRLIDFQLCFYGSLGFDVNYLLNTSTQLEVLREHRETLIELYADTLIETLEILPFDGRRPTRDVVRQEIRHRESYGFFVAFAFFPIMTMSRGTAEANTLENFHDEEFAREKIDKMFTSNPRTLATLKYVLKRFHEMGNILT